MNKLLRCTRCLATGTDDRGWRLLIMTGLAHPLAESHQPPPRARLNGDGTPVSLEVSPTLMLQLNEARAISGRTIAQEIVYRLQRSFLFEQSIPAVLSLRYGSYIGQLLVRMAEAMLGASATSLDLCPVCAAELNRVVDGKPALVPVDAMTVERPVDLPAAVVSAAESVAAINGEASAA